MRTIRKTSGILKRLKTLSCGSGRWNDLEHLVCNKCSCILENGVYAIKTSNNYYCLDCEDSIYIDSTINPTDEELETFFK